MVTSNLEEAILKSTCFGVAWDGTCKECKICEVKLRCEQRMKMEDTKNAKEELKKIKEEKAKKKAEEKPDVVATAKPAEASLEDKVIESSDTVKSTEKKVVPTKTRKTKEVVYSQSMPDFRNMPIEELLALLEERGGDPKELDKYTNASIKKMRAVMAVKKTYIVEE